MDQVVVGIRDAALVENVADGVEGIIAGGLALVGAAEGAGGGDEPVQVVVGKSAARGKKAIDDVENISRIVIVIGKVLEVASRPGGNAALEGKVFHYVRGLIEVIERRRHAVGVLDRLFLSPGIIRDVRYVIRRPVEDSVEKARSVVGIIDGVHVRERLARDFAERVVVLGHGVGKAVDNPLGLGRAPDFVV